jgi:hypothetical protein
MSVDLGPYPTFLTLSHRNIGILKLFLLKILIYAFPADHLVLYPGPRAQLDPSDSNPRLTNSAS